MALESEQSEETKIAERLFGKENLDDQIALSSNPLVLFCKERQNQPFLGESVDGFQSKFCNQTRIVQTDVGLCVSNNPGHYVKNGKIVEIDRVTYHDQILKNIENVIIINIDRYGQSNDFNVSNMSEYVKNYK